MRNNIERQGLNTFNNFICKNKLTMLAPKVALLLFHRVANKNDFTVFKVNQV